MRTTTRLAAVRAAAAAGALAVGLAGLGLGATAYADQANINDQTPTSLTIHKHVKPGAGDTTKGRVDGTTAPTQKPVSGVVFKAYKIKLDLVNEADMAQLNANWKTLNDWAVAHPNLAASVCDPANLAAKTLDGLTLADDAAVEFVTEANGQVKKNLDKGAYLLCETDTTNAAVDGKKVNIVDKALPFVVTLPYADATDGAAASKWVYYVHAFPKNTPVDKPVKNVKVLDGSHGLGTGSQIEYTIDAVVPTIAGDSENFKYLNIYDKFAQGTTDISVSSVQVGEIGPDGAFAGADVPGDKYTKTDDSLNRFAQVHFNTVEGLQYLETIGGKTIRVTFRAKISELPTDGKIENTGNYIVDTESDPSNPGKPPVPPTPNNPPVTPPTNPDEDPKLPPTTTNNPTNKVVSNWGELKVIKRDAANNKQLQGATFEVYDATPETAFLPDCSNAVKTGNAISVEGKTTFKSDATGTLRIPGLFIDSKASAGADVTEPDHTTRCYVLVETAAPAGYVLPSGDAAMTKVKVSSGEVKPDAVLMDVKNTKSNVPQLPLTGASGQVLMMAGGAALVLLAGGTVAVARRRQAED
ncbi:Fimbrial subunit type 1 precursor [Actinomyces bovis]|uniref:Fimbrial subunit type 1 n=1 Tax=Actinomyces bovis TaxID=1658 RepID=A0ABY1VM78_9ACTO|nr:SpaH/EbpB family LPXTG-anchored major pilin [Actinomyces bovis]SPT52928.1 Fimbrial subunit type 1 precursor [Actinomyces bovis]VEG55095.1 Fimbrial subunit type 1 precursor [Actinomyces israelii]